MSKKCQGCGIILQIDKPNLDGYTQDIENNLCKRCFTIKNYGYSSQTTKDNKDYLKILDNIKDDDLVVYISSMLTLNLDYINKFKNVLLVLTKRDIIPKSVKDNKIIKYINKKYPNILDILIVSAYKKYNLDNLYNKLIYYGENKNIYFVGITNSGKSSLLNELIKSYENKEGFITTSNYPSTTLGVVKVNIKGLTIYDTPGLIINNSIINELDSKGIKKVNSKKEIKPITFQVKGNGAILIDNIVRIEYTTNISSMTFYMSNNLNIDNISLKNPRLKDIPYQEYNIDNNKDIVIEDLGFIKCTNNINIKIYHNNNLVINIRDNLI